MNDQRTEQGVILRAALDEVKRRATAGAKQHAVAAVVTAEGVGIGYARLSPSGWEFDASLRAQWAAGGVKDVRAEIAWLW